MTLINASQFSTDDQVRYETRGLSLAKYTAMLQHLDANGIAREDLTLRMYEGLVSCLTTFSVQFTSSQALYAFGGSKKLLAHVKAGNVYIRANASRFSV